jgi:hypothetical protein
VPTEDSLYSAFAANPVNFTDETGGMIGGDGDDGEQGDDEDDHLVNLLDRLLQHPRPQFDANDRALLTRAWSNINGMVQQLVDRSEAISRRIHALDQTVRQMESSLQGLRQRETYAHYFRLIGDHLQQRRLGWHGMSTENRTRYINTILYTAQDLSDRRMSVAQRMLSERYLVLIRSRDQLIEELDSVNDMQQDLENWLDIYDAPIRRLGEGDESRSVAETDEEEDDDLLLDDDLFFRGRADLSVSPHVSDEEEADDARARNGQNPDESGNRGQLSPSHPGADRGGDGGALE